jgi:hypothetical protein
MEGRAEKLSKESCEVNGRVFLLSNLAGFALQLYSWYIQHGMPGMKRMKKRCRNFFYAHLPDATCGNGFL